MTATVYHIVSEFVFSCQRSCAILQTCMVSRKHALAILMLGLWCGKSTGQYACRLACPCVCARLACPCVCCTPCMSLCVLHALHVPVCVHDQFLKHTRADKFWIRMNTSKQCEYMQMCWPCLAFHSPLLPGLLLPHSPTPSLTDSLLAHSLP